MREPRLPQWALEMLDKSRVGHLATANARSQAFVVPVVYALLDDAIYIIVDEKPKSGRRLKRLRNIEETGNASLVVDHYDEDWSRLAWVLARGPARVIGPNDPIYSIALEALRDKYPQYHSMKLDAAEMIEIRPDHWTAWRADDEA